MSLVTAEVAVAVKSPLFYKSCSGLTLLLKCVWNLRPHKQVHRIESTYDSFSIMASPSFPMRGHCICRTIEYTINAPPMFTNCCHCRTCQNLSGSAFALNLMIEASNVSVTSSTQPITKSDARPGHEGSPVKSTHCPNCGTMYVDGWSSPNPNWTHSYHHRKRFSQVRFGPYV